MPQSLDFQSIIFTLQQFWAAHGCLIWQPYYLQVGAGTMNPGTFLRVLGPEPWKVGYVEPSVRPDDGRYGENPNRMQMHYQFQVILKPDPGNPQELYLESLEALGIDPRQHDIRFVEDNWEQPALGAWGLGWEVWLDGQEITQFTYFQQAGSIPLDPVSVEITYGLDRIAIALQKVHGFTEIHWNAERTSGDMNLQGEQEHSKYYFEIADVQRMQQLYGLYEVEAKAALEAGLVLPAYDYLLKCNYTFNVLDTRGAIGVTERQAYFGRMRETARKISEVYLEQRQHMEYPWLEETGAKTAAQAAPASMSVPVLKGKFPFLLEIGTEELPAADLQSAIEQLRQRAGTWLDELRLEHGEVKVYGTPRRLVVWAQEVAASQEDRAAVVKGPPEARAFDSLGEPTQAAQGFARSRGVAVKDLEVREIDGGRYVVALVHEPGRQAVEVLTESLPAWAASIKFDKSMRWNSSGVYFSRPVRWLLALYAGQVVPFEFAGLASGRASRGLRFYQPAEIAVNDPKVYFDGLARQGVILDAGERKEAIRRQVLAQIAEVGGQAELDEGLLDEVTMLVEAPTVLRGSFDAEYLKLPQEVLVSVMKKHQRYFPVWKQDGNQRALLPYFIAVRNGDDQHLDVVTEGNAQVILARFADAAFFINEDLRHPLESYLPRLGTLVFQLKLGSMLDKTHRIQRQVERLCPDFNLSADELAVARRATELCKADLVTHMVVEMTSLQGIMGKFYALKSGEKAEVAEAILEHYSPRFSGDAMPRSKAGLVIGLADRLDSLAGLFAAGLAPTGTKDPFAQRRAALGLVQILLEWDVDFDLRRGLALAAEGQAVAPMPEVQAVCLDFIVGRLRSYLMEQGFRYDVTDAVLAEQKHNPAGVGRAIRQLSGWVSRPDWSTILPAYARCVRITRDQPHRYTVDPARLVEPAERNLYLALQTAEGVKRRDGSVDEMLGCFQLMIPPINRFFDAVLVMAEENSLRENRLGLLQRIAALAEGVANFSLLEGF